MTRGEQLRRAVYVPPAGVDGDPVAAVNGALKWALAAWLILGTTIAVILVDRIEVGPARPATVSTTPNPPADGPAW